MAGDLGKGRDTFALRPGTPYKVAMPQMFKRFAFVFNAGALASILAHALILGPLVFGFPNLTLKPEEPKAVEVELAAAQEKPLPAPEPKTPEAKPKPPQVLRPVVKFAEKDAGSTRPQGGDAPRDTNSSGAKTQEARSERQALPPQNTPQPHVSMPKNEDAASASAPDSPGVSAPPSPPEANRQARLQERNESEVATTAKGDLPRAIRAGQLCATELRKKLNNSNPPYWPDLLPAYRLDQGNVLQVRRGAFRANAIWFNLEFRCKVDDAATEVVALEFAIGTAVPRSEWIRRGFPSM